MLSSVVLGGGSGGSASFLFSFVASVVSSCGVSWCSESGWFPFVVFILIGLCGFSPCSGDIRGL